MKTGNAAKTKTGIFVIAGAALILLFIFLIGSQQNLFTKTFRLHVNYRSVVGLKEGAFVRFNGINVGVVDLISILNDTTVRVDLSLQQKIKSFIKEGSRANISSDGLMGDKLIQILPAGDTSAEIKEHGQLVPVNPMDMDKVMARVETVGARIESIVTNMDTVSGHLANIFGRVTKGEGSLGKLVTNEKLGKDLQQTIATAKTTVKTAGEAAEGLKENMEAAKNNFLLRGYFKKKERKRIKDSIDRAKALQKKAEAAKENKNEDEKN